VTPAPAILAILAAAASCRYGFTTSESACVDGGRCDLTDASAAPTDAGTLDAFSGSVVPSGDYALVAPVSYGCAAGVVSVKLGKLTFVDDGAKLTVTSDDPTRLARPCVLTGATALAGKIDVGCTLPGVCAEAYRVVAQFTAPSAWTGTFTAAFTGLCLDCVNQAIAVSGARR
jgi:hypothetical protein